MKEITTHRFAQESLFTINHIYMPHLGKCEGKTIYMEDEGPIGSRVLRTTCAVLNWQRKDDEGTRYDIGNHFTHVNGEINIEIDLQNKTICGTYVKTWIGGLVERIPFTCTIDSIYGEIDKFAEEFHGEKYYNVTINCTEFSQS